MTSHPDRRCDVGTVRRAGIACLAAAWLVGWATVGHAQTPPNFVVILADDLGYSDIGSFGGEIRTPTLDRLADAGVRFSQFYNTGRCSPTRASLLTGRYPHSAGMGHLADDDWGYPGYRGSLRSDVPTIPELLAQAGYRSYMAGKWHLSADLEASGRSTWPIARGFDRFFGNLTGAGSYYDPPLLMRDGAAVAPDDDFFYTDAISAEAARFVRDHAHREPSRPFFLYVSYTAPHWPLHARPSDIERYRGRYASGWDDLRERRLRGAIARGVVPPDAVPAPRDPDVPAWPEVANRAWQERRMEVYAAQVDAMDQGIGRVVAALSAEGLLDNTLILFLSDNGACAEEFPRWLPSWTPLLSHVLPATTRGGADVRRGNAPDIMPGPETTFQTLGLGWANATNAPFRKYKSWVHEGGILTPMIAHWPHGLRRRSGSIVGTPGHVIDILPTFLALAGLPRLDALPGRSLSLASDGTPARREALYWEHEGGRAVRDGDWKLVSASRGPWELYNLADDPTESKNLVAQDAPRARRMAALYDRFAACVGVEPWPWVAAPFRTALFVLLVVLMAFSMAAFARIRRGPS